MVQPVVRVTGQNKVPVVLFKSGRRKSIKPV